MVQAISIANMHEHAPSDTSKLEMGDMQRKKGRSVKNRQKKAHEIRQESQSKGLQIFFDVL